MPRYLGEDAVNEAIRQLKKNREMSKEDKIDIVMVLKLLVRKTNVPITNYVQYISKSLKIDEFKVKQIITFLKKTGFISWTELG